MTYRGHVKNGVVVIEGDVALPEGACVTVAVDPHASPEPAPNGQTIWQKMQRLATDAEAQESDLPSDLAAQHDRCRNGLPMRP